MTAEAADPADPSLTTTATDGSNSEAGPVITPKESSLTGEEQASPGLSADVHDGELSTGSSDQMMPTPPIESAPESAPTAPTAPYTGDAVLADVAPTGSFASEDDMGDSDFVSYGGSDDDDDLEEEELPPPPPEVHFNIMELEPLGFTGLEEARTLVFASKRTRDRFETSLGELDSAGEEGRRRALGWWVLAEYEQAAKELQSHEQDDTAAFTRGKALGSLGQWNAAVAIFERLSKSYPDEPRPRAAMLEARLEGALSKDPEDIEALADEIAGAVAQAPGNFAETSEGYYIAGRAAEVRRDWEAALNSFEKGYEAGPADRVLISRFAHLAERTGVDDRAIALYEELMDMPPVERSTLMNLGVLYEDHGRDSNAAACYDIVHQNDGTDTQARLYLSDARAAMEMYYDEDMEKKEDRLNQILRIPITDFELSVRARNCLNKMQILALGDLVQRTEQELLSYKNFGETSLHEIKEILHSKGLRLGMPRDEAVASIEAHARRMSSGDRGDVMNKPILELQLSIRARRTVESLGCLTVGDVTKHSAEELLGMPNFGQTSLQELRNKLGELTLKLNGE
ncbi:MAG: DNA-directed RNA polymerase subunit alpha [Planctomycetota bacterium]|jgi:DNA-directed RNA polymerase subunit alpha